VLSIPLAGTWLASLLFGGEFPTPDLLSRLTILHVMLIPALIAGAVSVHLALVWRQKHTQFPGPGRTEETVTGSALWPTYALKSVGLFFVVAGVLAALAGLFQINPVWLYGPFRPWLSSSPAQPDIYVGWLDGALRLAPAWEPHIFGHTVPEPFLPGVVVPGVFFTIVALWPFIEARVTRDRSTHHLLQRPRDAPERSAVGAAGLTFIVILTLAGSNDLLAKAFNVEVETINAIDKVALVAGPIVVGWITLRVCCELRRRDLRPVARPGRVRITRTAAGGFAVREVPGAPSSAAGLRHEAGEAEDRHDDADEQDA
jgi:ubiquinol-cytochrome c reductase cytochrome b subunit